MPAYFDTGFSVRKPMWHGLGDVLDSYPENWDDARLAAGLMWEPQSVPVFGRTLVPVLPAPEQVPAGGSVICTEQGIEVYAPVPGFQGIARDDTGEILAVPSDRYQTVSHAQMGELLEAVIDADSNVKFETAGSVRGGRQVWALAYLDEPFQIPGDPSATYPFLAFLNSHDGSGACKVLPTDVRVVCWNTFNAASAQGDRTGHQVVIRHTGDIAARLEEAKQVLSGVREEAADWQVLATDLAGINVSDAVVQMFLNEFIPADPEGGTDRARANRERCRSAFMALYNESPTTDGIRGNAYGLVQTAGEYLDHLRPFRSADTYMTRTLLSPEAKKASAIRLVRECVASA